MQTNSGERMSERKMFEWDEMLTPQQVADLVGISLRTFQRWCAAGEGPVVTDLSGWPRYAASDVKGWLESRKRHVDDERGAA
jgi:predicted DNA-binding transcriptional regulator AlpA